MYISRGVRRGYGRWELWYDWLIDTNILPFFRSHIFFGNYFIFILKRTLILATMLDQKLKFANLLKWIFEMTLRVLSIGSAVNLPRLQILRIDGEWVIDNVIMQGRWRHSWEKNVRKRCCFNCNIWPNWFTSQARSRGRGRRARVPPEISRLELNSATKVEFFY